MAASMGKCFAGLLRNSRIRTNGCRLSLHTCSLYLAYKDRDADDDIKSRDGRRVDLINFLSQRIDLSPPSIERWLKKRVRKYRVMDQSFIEKRFQMLGPDLSAAHFIIYRNGAVRFQNQEMWHKKDQNNNISLPNVKIEGLFVEAIDASNTKLMYEGFDNLDGTVSISEHLTHLKWLSLKGCKYIDDWCLSRLQIFHDTLDYLDISECPLVTDRGIASLHHLRSLKHLKMYKMSDIQNVEMLSLMLEDCIPQCNIEGILLMALSQEQLKENSKQTEF